MASFKRNPKPPSFLDLTFLVLLTILAREVELKLKTLEYRSIIAIGLDSSEEEGPDLSQDLEVFPCNSTQQLNSTEEYFYIASDHFGESKSQYPPGQVCTYTIKVNKA